MLSRETSFTLPSFAKINLSLRVLGRRADGYHEIRTVFQTITLHDRLTFTALDTPRLELECDAADVPTDDTNLVARDWRGRVVGMCAPWSPSACKRILSSMRPK